MSKFVDIRKYQQALAGIRLHSYELVREFNWGFIDNLAKSINWNNSVRSQLAVGCLVTLGLCASAYVYSQEGARLDLPDLLTLAVTTHPAIQTQQAVLGAAREGVTSARLQYFPTPSVSVPNAASDSGDPSYGGDKSVTILGLNQPLWTGGRIEAGIERAQANAQEALANVADTQQQRALRVVQTYGDWLSAHRKRAAYQVGQTQHIRLKDQAARRIQEGQAAASDLALAQSCLASLQADYAQAVPQEEVSLARLSQLLGQPVAPLALDGWPAQPWPVRGSAGELLADQVLASWDRQYLSGRKSLQDLMNSTREQVQAQAQLADLDGSQLVASWRLAITTGQYALPSRALSVELGLGSGSDSGSVPGVDQRTATGPAL